VHSRRYTRRQRKATILIVDDTPANIQILAEALRSRYLLTVATSGAATLELLRTGNLPDLILLDIMMPDMDGYTVCRHLKRDPRTQNIPVIFVTAKVETEDQQMGFNIGAVDYITKPFQIPLVLARVRAHVRLKLNSDYLEQLARIDGLTEIPNRRAVEETVVREAGRAHRDRKALSVLMVDVDFFKTFNDMYGHGCGDECLRRVAEAIEGALCRPADFVGRYGGEEFVVILPDCTAKGALTVAGAMRTAVASLGIPHAGSSAAPHVTISVGLGFRPADSHTSAIELLTEADQMLYQAKARGRDQIAFPSTVAADASPKNQ
jgi:diguanylate cyclase (GGDEF)-like protein